MLDSSLLPITDGSRNLRLLAVQDIDRYLTGAQDPLVQEFGYLPATDHSEATVTQLIEIEAPERMARGDTALLGIVDVQDRFLGSLTLFNVTRESAELSVWLMPEARGAGHALGAIRMAATFAKQCGLDHLTARSAVESYAAHHVVERAGFQEVAREVAATDGGATYIHYRLQLRS